MVQEKAVLLDVTTVRILYALPDKTSYHKVMDKFAETIIGRQPSINELNDFEKETFKILVERANEGLESMRKRTAGLKQNQKHKE